MTLVAGSYERFLFGMRCPSDPSEPSPSLTRAFTHAAHKGVVKSLTSAGPFVASGGADDLIHLYDLRTDKDLGFLINPGEGSVSSLAFFTPQGAYAPTHLLAGCSDGTVSVWRAGGGWECLKTLRGHRGEVTAISVHPSGCLALTTSRDGTLKLWDLVKGRVTFSTKVDGGGADGVVFSPSGGSYALLAGSTVAVKPVAAAGGGVGEAVKLAHTRKALCCAFGGGGDSVVITGAEDGALRVWDATAGIQLLHIPRAHSTRIKAIAVPHAPAPPAKKKAAAGAGAAALLPQVPALLATASSDGVVKLWALREAVAAAAAAGEPTAADGGEAACLAQTDTTARLTTLCAVDPVEVMEERMREQAEARQEAAKVKRTHKKDKKALTSGGGAKKGAAPRPKEGGVQKRKAEEVKPRREDGVRRKDGTVSFLDGDFAAQQSKKARKVALDAQRAAQKRDRKQRRAKVPGSRGRGDA